MTDDGIELMLMRETRLVEKLAEIEAAIATVTDPAVAEHLLEQRDSVRRQLEVVTICRENIEATQHILEGMENKAARIDRLRHQHADLCRQLQTLEGRQNTRLRQAAAENPGLAASGVAWSLPGSYEYANKRADLERRIRQVESELTQEEGHHAAVSM